LTTQQGVKYYLCISYFGGPAYQFIENMPKLAMRVGLNAIVT